MVSYLKLKLYNISETHSRSPGLVSLWKLDYNIHKLLHWCAAPKAFPFSQQVSQRHVTLSNGGRDRWTHDLEDHFSFFSAEPEGQTLMYSDFLTGPVLFHRGRVANLCNFRHVDLKSHTSSLCGKLKDMFQLRHSDPSQKYSHTAWLQRVCCLIPKPNSSSSARCLPSQGVGYVALQKMFSCDFSFLLPFCPLLLEHAVWIGLYQSALACCSAFYCTSTLET